MIVVVVIAAGLGTVFLFAALQLGYGIWAGIGVALLVGAALVLLPQQ